MSHDSRPSLTFVFTLAVPLFLSACGAETLPSPDATESQAPSATTVQEFGNITFERLLNADSEPDQWLTEGRDFGKGHYSTLNQINRDNIAELGVASAVKSFTTTNTLSPM